MKMCFQVMFSLTWPLSFSKSPLKKEENIALVTHFLKCPRFSPWRCFGEMQMMDGRLRGFVGVLIEACFYFPCFQT